MSESELLTERRLIDHAASEGGSDALKDIVFGSVAGMTAKLFEHPFDLVKVRLQSQPTDRPLSFKGPTDCFRQTWGREGLRGLYRGVSAPIVGAAAENASLFLVYNKIQDLIRSSSTPGHTLFGAPVVETGVRVDFEAGGGMSEKALGKRREREMSMGELALAAGAAGACASFVLTPIELVKCRMQVQALAREGIAPLPAATASTSTSTSHLHPSTQPHPLSHPTSHSSLHTLKPPLTSPLTTLISTPPAAPRALPPLQGPLSIISSTLRSHGIRGLWLGQVGTLFRESGGSAAWFSAYEVVSRGFLRYHEKQRAVNGGVGVGEKLTKKDLKTWELVLAGASAGMSYNLILFPADSVKSAMQTQAEMSKSTTPHPHSAPASATASPKFWPTAKKIYAARGVRGLYAGCGVTVMRSAPSSAMIFLIYEKLNKEFGELL